METRNQRDILQSTAAAEKMPDAEGISQMGGSETEVDMPTLLSACAGETRAERYSRGTEVLKRIGGAGFDIPIHRLARVAPDLARFTVEFAYGDVLSRPGLDLSLRQVATVAALMANGSVQPQLKYHMTGYLNVGGEPAELVEMLFLAIAILGFPVAINAVGIVREIFRERGLVFDPPEPASDDGTARFQRGLEVLDELMVNPEAYMETLHGTSPELARWSVEFAFGEIFGRQGLNAKARQIAIISMLGAAGNRNDLLRLHIEAGVKAGLSPTEITEALMQLAIYAGFPSALNAFGIANAVFTKPDQQERDGEGDGDGARGGVRGNAIVSETRAARRERGLATLAKTSAQAGATVVDSFNDLAPDIGRAIIEHSYGDIFSRAGLDAITRELAACSALAAVGSKATETPLRVHVNAALTAGATPAEIVETLLNVLPYRGYPAVEESMRVAGEEFRKRGDNGQKAAAERQ
ncbi:carboxymuconolactone decarboxylase [Pandoraea morbifera]|uniref:Carboxymuconolactone decarboxylase n=1 Tax=Pandoraea morbifera TaxID=2508300 RepID=A0A5E4RJT0_9BURK|nr:carboxymuconolactone decarboxylase family protein [Pandoraea morbifera]VVD62299.1 carboxymuconolactone decarboxylase [Pandoraea morbifera]